LCKLVGRAQLKEQEEEGHENSDEDGNSSSSSSSVGATSLVPAVFVPAMLGHLRRKLRLSFGFGMWKCFAAQQWTHESAVEVIGGEAKAAVALLRCEHRGEVEEVHRRSSEAMAKTEAKHAEAVRGFNGELKEATVRSSALVNKCAVVQVRD
jgi:hypothetical protein